MYLSCQACQMILGVSVLFSMFQVSVGQYLRGVDSQGRCHQLPALGFLSLDLEKENHLMLTQNRTVDIISNKHHWSQIQKGLGFSKNS